MFLSKTVEDILSHIEDETEVIIGLDGEWADPPVIDDPRVTIFYVNESIGQRAMTNQLCKLSKAKYVMKVDAHCAFDQGFDRKMIEAMQDDWTMVPTMRNLHVFNWVCPDGHTRYQGKSGVCTECGKETHRDIVWIPKPSPSSNSYCFDPEPHFQYFREYNKRPEGRSGVTESMSLQGSCFMMTRDKYWELNICDEDFGSWGSQGIEVAVKTWLSGGKVMVNQNTWYAHCFRTQGGDFGFPYKLSGNQVDRAKKRARDIFFNDKWPQAVKPLSWLLERFWPVPGWTQADLDKLKKNSEPVERPKKGIIYYTDNQLNLRVSHAVQRQLKKIGLPIVSTSLKPMDFGKNIQVKMERGYLAMFTQILTALENSDAEYIFFCEHDVLYHPSHFEFTPPTKDKFYYNENVWKLNGETGHAVHYRCKQVSGICVDRELAIKHYRKRLEVMAKDGFSMAQGFEPGTHNRAKRIDDLTSESWMSPFPNVDVRHGNNLSKTRWTKEEFRNQKYTEGWTEAEEIPGWGKTKETFRKILPQ